jgi:hypothetical protein
MKLLERWAQNKNGRPFEAAYPTALATGEVCR